MYKTTNKCFPEVRQRAVRLVLDHEHDLSPAEAKERYYAVLEELAVAA